MLPDNLVKNLCFHVSEKGFDIVGFFLDGARITEIDGKPPRKEVIIKGYSLGKDHVILYTDNEPLVIKEETILGAENYGIQFNIEIINVAKRPIEKTLGIKLDLNNQIDLDQLMEYIEKYC